MPQPLTQTARTRSVLTATHLLHTPASFVRTPMPGLARGTAVVHACPALGAEFLWYTAELEPGGTLAPSQHNRLVYLLEGEATLAGPGVHETLVPGGFAFCAPHQPAVLTAGAAVRCAVIEKRYAPLAGVSAPVTFVGRESDITPTPLAGDPNLQVRALLPPDPAFDFAVNTMTYTPGAGLPQVEVHYMEHGLLMLAGEGLYLLGESWYPVQAGDFIWMAPYCPQWFAATGAEPAKYLIYKDFNRVPAL